jgi:hypothetical protein
MIFVLIFADLRFNGQTEILLSKLLLGSIDKERCHSQLAMLSDTMVPEYRIVSDFGAGAFGT